MPLGSRREMASQARVNRRTGTWVWLLIPPATTVSTNTPFNVNKSRKAIDPSTCTQFRVYAKVSSKPATVTNGEGGRTIQRTATVEVPTDWADKVDAAYAVKLVDGSVMLKKTVNTNDTGTLYILEVESFVANKN